MALCKIGTTVPLRNVILEFLSYIYSDDAQKYYSNYLIFSKNVYKELNFNILTSEIQKIFPIDKKLGTVKMPDDLLYWLQVSIIDEKKNIIPCLENDMKALPDYKKEVVPSACPNPKCNSGICSNVKAVTAIEEIVLFDFPSANTEYTNIIKKQMLADGSYIQEVCSWYPLGSQVMDYVATTDQYGAGYKLDKVVINGQNYPIDLVTTNISGIQTALNALDKGSFVVTNPSSTLVITSLENNNSISIMTIKTIAGPVYTNFDFDSSNAQSIIVDVVKECKTQQICEFEITDDGCVPETVTNVEIVAKNCCFPCCKKPKKEVPTVHVDNSTFYFSNNNYDQVLLTYKTSGINWGMELMIPEIAIPAMISGLAYHAVKHKRSAGRAERQEASRLYNIDKNKLVEMLNPMRQQELENVARTTEVIY